MAQVKDQLKSDNKKASAIFIQFCEKVQPKTIEIVGAL